MGPFVTHISGAGVESALGVDVDVACDDIVAWFVGVGANDGVIVELAGT